MKIILFFVLLIGIPFASNGVIVGVEFIAPKGKYIISSYNLYEDLKFNRNGCHAVFAVSIPDSIKHGDEIYFEIQKKKYASKKYITIEQAITYDTSKTIIGILGGNINCRDKKQNSKDNFQVEIRIKDGDVCKFLKLKDCHSQLNGRSKLMFYRCRKM